MVLALLASFAAHAGQQLPSLRESADPALQRELVGTLERLDLDGPTREGRLAVALVDITDLNHPRVAAVNGERMMYAASLPKIAILLAAFVQVERGQLELDAPTREQMTQMIRVSSNTAATAVLRKVGGRTLQDVLTSPRYRLYDPRENGGLWVGKEYGPGESFGRDPLHNLSHGATALQTAKFYYLLESGLMFDRPELTSQMKAMLGDSGIRHKFVKGLEGRPGARVYRKSGTWRDFHADSALVESAGRRFVMVALAHDPDGGEWLRRMAAPLHDLIVPLRVADR